VNEIKEKKEKKISYQKGLEIVKAIEKKLEAFEKKKSTSTNGNEYSF